ncbi:MAG: transposase [Acidimicrobiia bacterium]
MVNVHVVDRDQVFLMPPSLAEWLPDGHLAWFILDVVDELDLSGFYRSLRQDGRGGVCYDPSMMLAVLIYAYSVGERSSRRIQRRLCEDVAFRVVAANSQPDHATLARFRRRHQEPIAEVFTQVLGLCVKEGLVAAGVVAIDGTKIEANASVSSNRTRRRLVDEILREAETVDTEEDAELGDRQGDELPERWADRRGRGARLREALRQLDAEGPSDPESHQAGREAKEAELGRKLPGRKPDPNAKWGSRARTRLINVTDPDSRIIKDGQRYVQGYNAQAAVTEDQIVVAAKVTNAATDSVVFSDVVATVEENLARAGGSPAGTFVADAGYWSPHNATLDTSAEVLIAPLLATGGITDPDDPRTVGRKETVERLSRGEITVRDAAQEMGVSATWVRKLLRGYLDGDPEPAKLRTEMLQRLATETGAAAYAKRKITVEPVYGHLKANLGYRRFLRRSLDAVESEWRLICTVHNLTKIHRHRIATS